MKRIDGLEYSVKILNNKIYGGFLVNLETFYLRITICKYLVKTFSVDRY